MKIIQIDADYFTSRVLLFVFTSHTTFVCLNSPMYSAHYGGGVSRSTPFRLWVLHFHFRGVRFDILSIIITSLSLLRGVCVCVSGSTPFWLSLLHFHYGVCVSGSTPFQLSLFHFYYYGVCPVRHPFDCHYFTFTTVFVGFDILAIIIISLLLWCPSGWAYPFNCHYFPLFLRCPLLPTLLIILSLREWVRIELCWHDG